MNWLGVVLIVVGIVLTLLHPKFRPDASRLKIRGVAGPALVVLGILVLLDVIPT